ncbi:MAG TPA: menaquinone-dependent protoporphyrinogen IX dehydrogenase [Pseudomonadales bacterium]|nr:menaquinone-dependent protoporphyrinogen IX dehydrogenase [Pseudomonadales bacterium]
MAEILIVYSTTDGHTRRICERISEEIRTVGHEARLVSLVEDEFVDPSTFDAVIIGASVRYGKHRPVVRRYIERFVGILSAMPAALFSVNLVARDPAKCVPEGNPYLQKLLRQISWRPGILEVFAGKLDYPRYRLGDRLMIKLIMLITHGPIDVDTVEFTDWDQVAAFGRKIAALAGDSDTHH